MQGYVAHVTEARLSLPYDLKLGVLFISWSMAIYNPVNSIGTIIYSSATWYSMF
jgi:hypothetical protein